ncbi:Hypothetical predicted protein [Pelobates cultripes]|uniref:Uncharacterized protein n=1 Tax=Pelobates cultripes TaxID=61616 RepID=A0AAD1TAP3_PELCU|nr:Hypothetical predicted protein [Pelobates cultripes]
MPDVRSCVELALFPTLWTTGVDPGPHHGAPGCAMTPAYRAVAMSTRGSEVTSKMAETKWRATTTRREIDAPTTPADCQHRPNKYLQMQPRIRVLVLERARPRRKNRRCTKPAHTALQRSTEADSGKSTTKPTQEHGSQNKTALRHYSYACYTYLTAARGPRCSGRMLAAGVLKLKIIEAVRIHILPTVGIG